ncbi:MAG: hypothetical protein AAFU70_13525, partial [Planctomycetota bacterium]
MAVRIESLRTERTAVDLIAGLAVYDGRAGALRPSTREPERHRWFGYSRVGAFLGASEVVDVAASIAASGGPRPESPLRDHCRRRGARYCYDVDWAKAVAPLAGEPMLFLSRPVENSFMVVKTLLPSEQ